MTVVIGPNNGAMVRIEFKRLPDGGEGFVFPGRWKCFHQPDGWRDFRTITDDGAMIDFDGSRGTSERDGGLIIVHFPSGGREWLIVDPNKPNELNGSNGSQSVTWIRQ